MLGTWLRAARCAERLPRSPWAPRPRLAPTTRPRGRWAPREPPGLGRRSLCTRGAGARRPEGDAAEQLPGPRGRPEVAATTAAQRVKAAGRDVTYLTVVLLGLGVTGALLYAIFKELFSSSSPNKIYGRALDKCRSHPEVVAVFGEPVKGFGEATRRGRRQHVSFLEHEKDGLKHVRVKFYIQGSEPGRRGTVHLEVKENPKSGEYEFRYMFVEVDSYPGRVIVVEDNRS